MHAFGLRCAIGALMQHLPVAVLAARGIWMWLKILS
jgi:hypothetical protein